MTIERIRVIDTHTGGEPTRVVVDAPFQLEGATLAEQRQCFDSQYDDYRRAIVCEPRGSDVMVGALVTPPTSADSVAGVLFFNNVGTLGMCGHGTIGVAVALAYLGKINQGSFQLDTPVGTVGFELQDHARVRIQNVPSFRHRKNVPVALPSGQVVHGDVAWGGNWFFICEDHGLDVRLSSLDELDCLTCAIRNELDAQQIYGADEARIDHIELIGPPSDKRVADARNYVMCPGAAYDRSPCGTGTSAKIACLAEDGKLAEDAVHRQESIVGSVFEATYHRDSEHRVIPTICGTAYVNAESHLILDSCDPFRMGIQ